MDYRKAGVVVCMSIRKSLQWKPCHIPPIICIIDFSYRLQRRSWAGGAALGSQDQTWLDQSSQGLDVYRSCERLCLGRGHVEGQVKWEYFPIPCGPILQGNLLHRASVSPLGITPRTGEKSIQSFQGCQVRVSSFFNNEAGCGGGTLGKEERI